VVISLDLHKALEARSRTCHLNPPTTALRAVSGPHLFPRFRRYRHSHPSQVCTVSGLRVGARKGRKRCKVAGKTAPSVDAHTRTLSASKNADSSSRDHLLYSRRGRGGASSAAAARRRERWGDTVFIAGPTEGCAQEDAVCSARSIHRHDVHAAGETQQAPRGARDLAVFDAQFGVLDASQSLDSASCPPVCVSSPSSRHGGLGAVGSTRRSSVVVVRSRTPRPAREQPTSPAAHCSMHACHAHWPGYSPKSRGGSPSCGRTDYGGEGCLTPPLFRPSGTCGPTHGQKLRRMCCLSACCTRRCGPSRSCPLRHMSQSGVRAARQC
jgi:hypothetical protein